MCKYIFKKFFLSSHIMLEIEVDGYAFPKLRLCVLHIIVRRLWKNQIILFVFILTARPFLWNDVFFMCQWIRIKLVVSCMVQEKQVWKLFFLKHTCAFFSVKGNIDAFCSSDNPDPDSDTEGSTRTMRLLKLHYHQQQVSSWSLFFAPYSRQTNKQTNPFPQIYDLDAVGEKKPA